MQRLTIIFKKDHIALVYVAKELYKSHCLIQAALWCMPNHTGK